MFDGVVRSLSNVKHVPKLRKSLISVGALDNLGYDFSTNNNIMKINKGGLVAMKVELPHEKFFTNIKEIVKAEERDKMITTRFLAKITH